MPELETLLASILYLMTRQSQSPKAGLEQAIFDHLQMLSNHPDCNSEVLKNAGERVSLCWRQEARVKQLGLEGQPTSPKRVAVH